MFKLLSKEGNIFSIPVYIIFLLAVVFLLNVLNFTLFDTISASFAFLGVALGYFVLDQIDLTHKKHLPYFLYTVLILSIYDQSTDIGIAIALFINSISLFFLTSTKEYFRNGAYVLVGALAVVEFLFLPTLWPLLVFFIAHIIATSQNTILNLFRFFLGAALITLSYFGVMYFLNFNSFDPAYLPIDLGPLETEFYPLYLLGPVFLMLIYAVVDHFSHYNEKSPSSKYKYTFLLMFLMSLAVTIVLYMGHNFEYLLLSALPISIILSRMLTFLPKYWMQELSLWIIIGSLVLFKIGNYYQLF